MMVYKRHLEGCQYRHGSKKDSNHAHRCNCSIYVEWSVKAKQFRKAVRDASGQFISACGEADKLVEKNRAEGPEFRSHRPKVAVTLQNRRSMVPDRCFQQRHGDCKTNKIQ